MRLASTTNAWNLWRQPGYCCGLGLPFNDADRISAFGRRPTIATIPHGVKIIPETLG